MKWSLTEMLFLFTAFITRCLWNIRYCFPQKVKHKASLSKWCKKNNMNSLILLSHFAFYLEFEKQTSIVFVHDCVIQYGYVYPSRCHFSN